MGKKELKWHQLTHIQLMGRKDLILVHSVQLKPTIKAQISGRMASIGVRDVVTTSVYSEKTGLKKLMLIMNKSQETMIFGRRQILPTAMKLRLEK